jgi:hypothetical protein
MAMMVQGEALRKLLTIYSPLRVDEDEIEARTEALRKKLTLEADGSKTSSARNLKAHQVHDLAAAKIDESERLRKALGISKDYEEGSHWKRQEERLRDAVVERSSSNAKEQGE